MLFRIWRQINVQINLSAPFRRMGIAVVCRCRHRCAKTSNDNLVSFHFERRMKEKDREKNDNHLNVSRRKSVVEKTKQRNWQRVLVGWLADSLVASGLRVLRAQRVVVSCVTFGRANEPNCDRHSQERRRRRRHRLECTMNQTQSDKFKMTSN